MIRQSLQVIKHLAIFWNDVFHFVSCIPQNEMVVLASDMNGHIGSSNVGYDGTHGGFW